MFGRGREQVDHDDPGNDQCNTCDGGQIKFLAKHDQADDGYQDDSQPRPHRIHDSDRHGSQGQRQEPKRPHKANQDHDRGPKLGELLAGLDRGCSSGFKDNCDDQVDVMCLHGPSLNQATGGVTTRAKECVAPFRLTRFDCPPFTQV